MGKRKYFTEEERREAKRAQNRQRKATPKYKAWRKQYEKTPKRREWCKQYAPKRREADRRRSRQRYKEIKADPVRYQALLSQQRRRHQSERWKVTYRAWRKSERGKKLIADAKKRYNASPKGRAHNYSYSRSPKARRTKMRNNQSPKRRSYEFQRSTNPITRHRHSNYRWRKYREKYEAQMAALRA